MRVCLLRITLCILMATVAGCGTVRQIDLDSWVGQPVAALETHPFFITVPVVKTVASDGTEIWNYVNGAEIGSCSRGGSIFSGPVNFATYTSFSNCVAQTMACNNIFYIKDKVVLRFIPVGTGGARCMTDETLQPKFRSPRNF